MYELLYTQVFGLEEAELCQAMEAFKVGSRRYRNSPSVCSDADTSYDTPDDRGHRYVQVRTLVAPPPWTFLQLFSCREEAGAGEDKPSSEETKVKTETDL